MEYVNFYPKTFHQIEEQDNPGLTGDECLMIVRECSPVQNPVLYVVLYVKPGHSAGPYGFAFPIAVFWKEYHATWFCNNFDPENL
jgi:hypothetical protein